MSELALPRCGRTSAIVEAILDGVEPSIDRSHIAACGTCRLASERALRFNRSLAIAAAEVGDSIPEPALVRGSRFGLFSLRMAPIATLTGAIAVGLVVAAIIGSRGQPPTGEPPSTFSSAAAAREELASMGFACGELEGAVTCASTALDHVHRVLLTEGDGRVVEVEVRIESTDEKALDTRGADVLFARIAAAVLTPEAEAVAASWLRDAFPTCGGSCSTEVAELRLALAVDSRWVSLTLRER